MKTAITIDQFCDFVNGFSGERPKELRLGQWAFTRLFESHPFIADVICGSDCDPFHRDELMPVFLKKVLDFVE